MNEVVLREKNNNTEQRIPGSKQRLTNKACTLPSGGIAVKYFTGITQQCFIPVFCLSCSSCPPHSPQSPSKSPFPFQSISTSGGGRSPQKYFSSLHHNRYSARAEAKPRSYTVLLSLSHLVKGMWLSWWRSAIWQRCDLVSGLRINFTYPTDLRTVA